MCGYVTEFWLTTTLEVSEVWLKSTYPPGAVVGYCNARGWSSGVDDGTRRRHPTRRKTMKRAMTGLTKRGARDIVGCVAGSGEVMSFSQERSGERKQEQ